MNALPHIAVVANPHFMRLGGEAAVARLVDAFYAAMDRRADARLARRADALSPHSHASPTRSPP